MPETFSDAKEVLGNAPRESTVIKWDLEDPSEFRPGLNDVGKDAESFRGFYDVSCTSNFIFTLRLADSSYVLVPVEA